MPESIYNKLSQINKKIFSHNTEFESIIQSHVSEMSPAKSEDLGALFREYSRVVHSQKEASPISHRLQAMVRDGNKNFFFHFSYFFV